MNLSRKKDLFLLLLLGAAAVLLFSPSAGYSFLYDWDDGGFIVTNPALTFTWKNLARYFLAPYQDLYTPLPMVSFMLDKALFGLDPAVFHIHNIILHALAAMVLFGIFRRLGVQRFPAFFAALLWAIHPQKAESVCWIVERKDLLCGLFAFLAVYAWLKDESRKKISYLSGIFSLLAIASKPAAVCLPGVILVLAFCLSRTGKETAERFKRAILPAGCGIAGAVFSLFMSSRTMPGKLETDPAVLLHNLFRYPLTAIIPYDRNPVYPLVRGMADALPVIGCGTILLLIFCLLARRSGIPVRKQLCALLLAGGTMLPVLGLIRYTDFHFCDRYNYIASAVMWGWCALLLTRFYHGRDAKILLSALLFLTGVVYTSLTLRDMPVWKDCTTLVRTSLARSDRINISIFKIGFHTALRSEDLALQRDLISSMKQNTPFLKETIAEHVLKMTLLFMEGHVEIVSGNFMESEKKYAELLSMAHNFGSSGGILWGRSASVMYHDLAVLRRMAGDNRTAVTLLEREIYLLQQKNDTSLRLWNAKAMKAELEGNNAELAAAWLEILRKTPEDSPSAKYGRELLKRLKKVDQ